MTPTFSIVTLGCKTNQFESSAMTEKLLQAGYRKLEFEEGADLVLVNTCTVTANTDAQSRNLIRRARRFNENARIIVTGCYAQVEADTLADLPGVALVLGNQEKLELLEHLAGLSDDTQGLIEVGDIRSAAPAAALAIAGESGRSRAFLQIQNGCDAFCSYCIIPYARGRSRSVASVDILRQVDTLVNAGHEELVLTGIHIGQYGKDLAPQMNLLGLVEEIESRLGDARLRLGSLEPTELPQDFRRHLAGATNICPHYHVPLQSGIDRILKQMRRQYSCGYFSDLMHEIREEQPDAGIGVDLIVGFPGETDEDFDQIYNYVDSLPISYLHVFPYSRRPGTPAASLAGQVPGDVARERAARMRSLSEAKMMDFSGSFVGRTLDVIPEKGVHAGRMKAVAGNYLNVSLPARESDVGRRVKALIKSVGSSGLEAEFAS